MTTSAQECRLQTADGHTISALHYPALAPRGAVLIPPAMGIPQDYYRAFSEWLVQQGHAVLTLDYRGMGHSRREPLRGLEATVFTWAEQDVRAALDELVRLYPGLPITWIGHSLGGQIMPLVPGHERVSKIITIACGSGYWKENSPPLKRRVWLLWFGVAPLTMPLFGYFPGKMFQMVGDLPRGVMTQWRRWCLHPDYIMGIEGSTVRPLFDAVTLPLTSLSFSDDEFMSAHNTESLHSFYRHARKKMIRLSPDSVGLTRIGHFGFFRKGMAKALWEPYLLPELATTRQA